MIWRRLLMTSVACFEYAGLYHLHTHLCRMHCALTDTYEATHTSTQLHTLTHTHTHTPPHTLPVTQTMLIRARPSNDSTRESLKSWLDYNMIRIRVHSDGYSHTYTHRVIRSFLQGICHLNEALCKAATLPLCHSATAAHHSAGEGCAGAEQVAGFDKVQQLHGLH